MQMHKGILQSNATIVAFIQRVLDIVIIVATLWVSTYLHNIPWLLQHTTAALLAVFLFHFTSELDKLYISWRGLSLYKELKKTISHWFISAAVLFLSVNFIAPEYLNPTGLQLAWFTLATVLLGTYRIFLRFLLRLLRAQGYNTRNVVVVGAGVLGQKLANNIIEHTSFGLVFSGYYDDETPNQKVVAAQTLGDLEQLVADCKNGGIDRVYIVLPTSI
ncbi:hypothetical protein [Pseudoalteromonas sp. B62]|uniref:hypothetical protein n=1 Tax=Pseudoalteromonas sp. B62 TaxID=630483 RepID=UPI00301D3D13